MLRLLEVLVSDYNQKAAIRILA